MEKFENTSKAIKDRKYFDDIAYLSWMKEKYPLGNDEQKKLKNFLDNATPEDLKRLEAHIGFQYKYHTLFNPNSNPDETAKIVEEMKVNPELKIFIDERLPTDLTDKYLNWKEGGNGLLSDNQLKMFFDYLESEPEEIMATLKRHYILEHWHPESDLEDVDRAMDDVNVELSTKKDFEDLKGIVAYLDGKDDERITNRMIEDEKFRDFVDRLRVVLGK